MLDKLRRFIDPYILLMAATVGLAVVFSARGQYAVVAGAAANTAIVFLFFLYGARFSTKTALDGFRHWRLHAAVLISTFALFPLLGITIKAALPGVLQPELYSGFLFLCALPSTVQSSIAFTSIARGNVPAALCSATASNILGIFITPALAGLMLATHGAQLNTGVLQSIVLQLLVPFIAGQILRRWIGPWVLAQKRILGLLDRGSILLIIYVAFSKGMSDHIWDRITAADFAALLFALALLLALIISATRFVARRLMKLKVEDEIVLVFCGSKKSLASGLPIASVLFVDSQLGMAVLPLMLFHQLQLIVCAWLARRYGERPISEPTSILSATPAGAEK
jgi:sodium/bile acid cotransporter 7